MTARPAQHVTVHRRRDDTKRAVRCSVMPPTRVGHRP